MRSGLKLVSFRFFKRLEFCANLLRRVLLLAKKFLPESWHYVIFHVHQGCAARNVHGFTQDDIQKMARQWEEAPSWYLQLDVKVCGN